MQLPEGSEAGTLGAVRACEDLAQWIEEECARHRSTRQARIADLAATRRQFETAGLALVTGFLPPGLIEAVGQETRRLLEQHTISRDFRMAETGHTRRKMRNIRYAEIQRFGSAIPAVYRSIGLREILADIAGEPLFTCPYQDERYVITCLEERGDTHGWHWDDYSFALVWVVEAPPPELGGFVQCVPRTVWDKRNPRLGAVLAGNKIHSHAIGSGHAYLLRSDTTLHRVYPLLASARRIIVNMAWASGGDLGRNISHETMDALWSAPDQPERDSGT